MASAHYVPFDKRRFNKGNVDFELLITNNTRIKKSGYFKCEKKNPDIKTVEISNLIKGPSTICKCFLNYNNRYYSFII